MEILYSAKASKQLMKISKSDKKSAKIILEKIEEYAIDTSGHYDIKVLKGKHDSFKRLRAGDYRIIFDEDNNILHIYEIKHRQEAYK